MSNLGFSVSNQKRALRVIQLEEIDKELNRAKSNEAYHRKQMEYFQEEIKILEKSIKRGKN